MSLKGRKIVGVATLLLVVGCSPASQSATPTSKPSATAASSGSAASPTPVVTAGPGAGTTFHLAADLEAKVPTDASGTPLTVESVVGTGFGSNGSHAAGLRCRWYSARGLRCRDDAGLADLLSRLGKTPTDVTIAVGYDRTRGKLIEIQATRIAGASGQQILDAQLALERARATKAGRSLGDEVRTVGSRSVVLIRPARPYPIGDRYLLAGGDVLYEIRKADEGTVGAIIAHLG